MYKKRQILSSGRVVTTSENDNEFSVISCADRVHGPYLLNDCRFSAPLTEDDFVSKDPKGLLNDAFNQHGINEFERGLSIGLQIAHTIMMRHYSNHKLKKPHDPDTLFSWDEQDISKADRIPSRID